MRSKYYHVYLTYKEYSELIKQLVESKNKLQEQGILLRVIQMMFAKSFFILSVTMKF